MTSKRYVWDWKGEQNAATMILVQVLGDYLGYHWGYWEATTFGASIQSVCILFDRSMAII